MGNWAFSWVQVIAHNKVVMFVLSAVICLFAVSGLFANSVISSKENLFELIWLELGLVLVGLTSISILLAWFLDSIKIGLLQFFFSSLVLLVTLGLLAWFDLALDEYSLLGFMVVLTVMTSNLVHVFSTLSREMARGLFQFDAIAEAIKLNASPIFLSNFTTALGFVIAATLQPQLYSLSLLVVVGVTISFIIILTLLPLVVLSWLLEFRVGNTADRRGLTQLAKIFEDSSLLRNVVIVFGLIGFFVLGALNLNNLDFFYEFLLMLIVFTILFWFAWGSIKLALLNVFTAVLALLLAMMVFQQIVALELFEDLNSPFVALIWLVPLGIIIDDGIHFFSRYARAKNSIFSDSRSAVIYSMSSVGRPIWITSWVLILALMLLAFSHSAVVQQAAILTIIAVAITAAIVLVLLPSLLMSSNKKRA